MLGEGGCMTGSLCRPGVMGYDSDGAVPSFRRSAWSVTTGKPRRIPYEWETALQTLATLDSQPRLARVPADMPACVMICSLLNPDD
jgi:hypothetical protein